MDKLLDGKRILITGGTGSLGTALVRRILTSEQGNAGAITILSRNEGKQYEMRQAIPDSRIRYVIGDVRDYQAVTAVLKNADIVFHAAALKHVDICERNPVEARQTNVHGAENIVRAIRDYGLDVETVIGVSTDKACLPVCQYGRTKADQELTLIQANYDCPCTRFVLVRYGNVLASNGSVIPKFIEQVKRGGPLTITDPDMTRFWLSLDGAIDTLFAALAWAHPGEIFVPRILSARMGLLADVLMDGKCIEVKIIGTRGKEKQHEVLISQEEANRTVLSHGYYAITPDVVPERILDAEYSSADSLVSAKELTDILISAGIFEVCR